jgi:hypothetical protein
MILTDPPVHTEGSASSYKQRVHCSCHSGSTAARGVTRSKHGNRIAQTSYLSVREVRCLKKQETSSFQDGQEAEMKRQEGGAVGLAGNPSLG